MGNNQHPCAQLPTLLKPTERGDQTKRKLFSNGPKIAEWTASELLHVLAQDNMYFTDIALNKYSIMNEKTV